MGRIRVGKRVNILLYSDESVNYLLNRSLHIMTLRSNKNEHALLNLEV